MPPSAGVHPLIRNLSWLASSPKIGPGKVRESGRAEGPEQTYYRWRQKYGGMQPVMVKQLKSLEKENSRLKKLVADQALDMEILKEAAKGNW